MSVYICHVGYGKGGLCSLDIDKGLVAQEFLEELLRYSAMIGSCFVKLTPAIWEMGTSGRWAAIQVRIGIIRL